MGTTSSIESEERRPQTPRVSTKKDIHSQMIKEFGYVADKNSANENPNRLNDNLDRNSNPEGMTFENQNIINPAVFKAKRLFMKPITKSRPKENNLMIKKQSNGGLLKELYRRMDPSVNQLSTRSIVGEIEVAVKYKVHDKMLLVKICRGKGLHQEDLYFPNPYVSVCLFDKINVTSVPTCQTKVKINTFNPVFQEILMFSLEERNVANSNIQISVWDKKEISEDEFLGQVLVELCKLNLNTGNMLWYTLTPQLDTSITGSATISLTYDPMNNNLRVNVQQANNLKIADLTNNTSHPFVRMYVTGIPSKAECEAIDASLDPVWNHACDFDIHQDEFSRRNVIINILSKDKNGGRAIRLGDVHIPLVNISTSDWGQLKAYELRDLRHTDYSRSKWSEEGVSMEFKEAMKAHVIYGYPKFLFKKEHVGKMMVSCYSEKAKTQAKMIIGNGIPTMENVQM